MKNILIIILLFVSSFIRGQDVTPIVIDLPDNPRLQYNGAAVKQRGIVQFWQPVINGTKEFFIRVKIQNWSNNSGAYGSLILNLIYADGTLSVDQQNRLGIQYGDWIFEHNSTGVWCDNTTGAITTQFQQDGVTPTLNAVTEAAYWQQFKLNQVSGVTAINTQGAFDSEYKIIKAVVAQMSTRKNW